MVRAEPAIAHCSGTHWYYAVVVVAVVAAVAGVVGKSGTVDSKPRSWLTAHGRIGVCEACGYCGESSKDEWSTPKR